METHVGEYHQNEVNAICSCKDSQLCLSCKLVPVQYLVYNYGLLVSTHNTPLGREMPCENGAFQTQNKMILQ